jgi:hypothetical protein
MAAHIVWLLVAASAVVALAGLRVLANWGREKIGDWGIAIYTGDSPVRLRPHPATGDQPVLTASDIHDVRASFIADPFIWRSGSSWHLFFEILEKGSGRGVIGVATSPDGIVWRYQREVLREPFHLSYPLIVEDCGRLFMIPECAKSGFVRLYSTTNFPFDWVHECNLLEGPFRDPSVFRHGDHWWMFVTDEGRNLRLFSSPVLAGPWAEHPASPVVRDSPRHGRSGGRPVEWQGGIIRFAQDGSDGYGTRVWAFRIDELDKDRYRETEIEGGPVIGSSGSGWHADGMHQVDAHELSSGNWIAAVDGYRSREVVNWRAALRTLQSRVLRLRR